MEKEAVSNSSSIIYLAKLNILNLAKNIFTNILLPKQVVNELFVRFSPENEIIRKELGKFFIETEVKKTRELPLDKGEKEAISLCLEKDIKKFLSDDRKARLYANSLGIEVMGVIGILLLNLENRYITKGELHALLDKLIKNGYYLSPPIYAKVMKLIEEWKQ